MKDLRVRPRSSTQHSVCLAPWEKDLGEAGCDAAASLCSPQRNPAALQITCAPVKDGSKLSLSEPLRTPSTWRVVASGALLQLFLCPFALLPSPLILDNLLLTPVPFYHSVIILKLEQFKSYFN